MSMLALSVNFSISTGICCSKCQSSADPFAIPEQADAIKKQVEFFYLSDVTLGEGIFKHAMMLDRDYILALNPDRLLAPYYKEAGKTPKAENYTNWENTGLDGHIGGHYLSALSLMYASTKDAAVKERLDYYISELKSLQAQDGYLSGVPRGREIWKEVSQGNIQAGSFSLNRGWVPLYNIHKIFAGLKDCYTLTGNEDAKIMLIKLTDWFYTTVQNLSDAQIQDMLRSEYGGLNESFADVYEITGDKKYLELARKFSHDALLIPMSESNNTLTGMHANTQIPKVIGFKRIADLSGVEKFNEASVYFWDEVVNNRTVSIGGNSVREHFHPGDNFRPMLEDVQGPETCNTYNMLKLSKMLYATSDDAKYVDFYERAMYNHILSTQHPATGGFVYFTPMRSGHNRKYSQPHECFWCCVGSGIENHAKYGEMIYARNEESLFVNLFIPSTLEWNDKNMKITQSTNFPYEDRTELTVNTSKSRKMNISFRIPQWTDKANIEIFVNGKKADYNTDINKDYATVSRKFKDGDKLTYKVNMSLHTMQLPDKSDNYSLMYGPVVLAARIPFEESAFNIFADDSRGGHIAETKLLPLSDMPKLIGNTESVIAKIEKVNANELKFRIAKESVYPSRGEDLIIEPFFKIHEDRYAVYFPIVSKEECAKLAILDKEAQEKAQILESITVDHIGCGEQQPESDHFIDFDNSWIGYDNNGHFRVTKSYFSYLIKNNSPSSSVIVYSHDNNRSRETSVYINETLLGSIIPENGKSEYSFSIPEEYKNEKQFKLSFKTADKKQSHNIYGVRVVR